MVDACANSVFPPPSSGEVSASTRRRGMAAVDGAHAPSVADYRATSPATRGRKDKGVICRVSIQLYDAISFTPGAANSVGQTTFHSLFCTCLMSWAASP